MASCLNTSIDAALAYARSAVGHAGAAQLLRAAIFDDGIEEDRELAPQLAVAMVRALERHPRFAAYDDDVSA